MTRKLPAQPGKKANLVQAPCAYCGGRGKDRFQLLSTLSTCGVCGGSGAVEIEMPFHRCAFCNRSGVHPHKRLSCTACMGKGVIHVEEPVKKCPACQGFGRDATRDSQLYCTTCGGAGVVSVSPSANFKKA